MITTINYPNKGKKQNGNTCTSLGRNGSMQTTGLEVMVTHDSINLAPINSYGYAGRCSIELPKDTATLSQLAAIVQNLLVESCKTKA